MEFIFPASSANRPPLNRDQLIMLAEDNVGNPQPADNLFGLQPIPFQDGIARYLKR